MHAAQRGDELMCGFLKAMLVQSPVDPEYQRMNRERSQAAAARNRTLQVLSR